MGRRSVRRRTVRRGSLQQLRRELRGGGGRWLRGEVVRERRCGSGRERRRGVGRSARLLRCGRRGRRVEEIETSACIRSGQPHHGRLGRRTGALAGSAGRGQPVGRSSAWWQRLGRLLVERDVRVIEHLFVGCIDIGIGCIDIGIGCIDIGIGCIDIGIGCIDIGIGCIDIGRVDLRRGGRASLGPGRGSQANEPGLRTRRLLGPLGGGPAHARASRRARSVVLLRRRGRAVERR
ncbi:hypothetical protein [Sorangium cellulosum]|uniref:hypothetical protein n=1 Tax=Sorangium cellulosum TaxID=56 RepID=UPI001A9346CA|nr:hypothetical protein [Sorangium cellulosum]